LAWENIGFHPQAKRGHATLSEWTQLMMYPQINGADLFLLSVHFKLLRADGQVSHAELIFLIHEQYAKCFFG